MVTRNPVRQLGGKIESVFRILSVLIHQFTQISVGKKKIAQQDLSYLTSGATLIYPILCLIYIAHFYVNDQVKAPRDLYIKYRFGMAAAYCVLWATTYFGRRRRIVVQGSYLALATLLGVIQAWSMAWGPKISIKWLIWLPTFVFVLTSNSFLFSAGWITLLVYVTRPFWQGRDFDRALFSDYTFALFILAFSQLVRRIWITGQVNYILYENARAALEEEEKTFYNQIKRFISPVFVGRIEGKRRDGYPPIAALDEVLKRRLTVAATMFSDIRNYSERADEPGFIERELIPSAAAIIDSAEQNLGIAKQIGDAVLVYYDHDDPEENMLRALRDAVVSAYGEEERMRRLSRTARERYFSIAFGPATVGNMASDNHREATIIGYSANLAARLDALTKDQRVQAKMGPLGVPSILLSDTAANVVRTFSKDFELDILDLEEMKTTIRSFPKERRVVLFPVNRRNTALLNRLLEVNNVAQVPERSLGD